jgi:hypothetical protein
MASLKGMNVEALLNLRTQIDRRLSAMSRNILGLRRKKSRPATFGHCRLSSCFMPGLLSPRRSIQDKVLMFESTKAGENVE